MIAEIPPMRWIVHHEGYHPQYRKLIRLLDDNGIPYRSVGGAADEGVVTNTGICSFENLIRWLELTNPKDPRNCKPESLSTSSQPQ